MKRLVLICAGVLVVPLCASADWVQDNMMWQQQQQQIQNQQQERVLGYSYGADNESIQKRVAYEKAERKKRKLDDMLRSLEIEANAVEDNYKAEKARILRKYTKMLEDIKSE